jgi:hypothetical protein
MSEKNEIQPGPDGVFDDTWHDQQMNIYAMYERINARADKAVKAHRPIGLTSRCLYVLSGGKRKASALGQRLSSLLAEMTIRQMIRPLQGRFLVPGPLRNILKQRLGAGIPRSALLLTEAANAALRNIRDKRRRQPGYVAGPTLEEMIAQRDAREAVQAAQALSEKTESTPQSFASPDSAKTGDAPATPKPKGAAQ